MRQHARTRLDINRSLSSGYLLLILPAPHLLKEEPLVIIIRIAVAAVLTLLAISFLGFAGYDKPKDLTRIETAIVFTGADERVRSASSF